MYIVHLQNKYNIMSGKQYQRKYQSKKGPSNADIQKTMQMMQSQMQQRFRIQLRIRKRAPLSYPRHKMKLTGCL